MIKKQGIEIKPTNESEITVASNEKRIEEVTINLMRILVEDCPENAYKAEIQYVNIYWQQLYIYFKVVNTDHEKVAAQKKRIID